MLTPSPTESEVCALRNGAFGKASTDNNWEACKEKWMHDIQWLRNHQRDAGSVSSTSTGRDNAVKS
jgi:hypothetical protein